ncbi:MAG: hypothetical protein ACOX6H_00540 [Christensenellales bacterium]|jgi:hypothetical protein
MKKYVILELIPTHSNPQYGDVAQLQALKIEDYKMLSRFDCRLEKSKIKIADLAEMISYDDDSFRKLSTTEEMMKQFSLWSENLPVYILKNGYTEAYLNHHKIFNEQVSILDELSMSLTPTIFDELIEKFNLQPSPHFVDLLFEALIAQSNY